MITIKNPKNSGMSAIFPKQKKYTILDWSNVIRRAYHSTTENKSLELLIFMLAKIKRNRIDGAFVIALEGTGRDIRASMFPPYKANRKIDEKFLKFECKCRELLRFVKGTLIKAPKGEADDAVACFIHKMDKGDQAILISEDRDLWQLLKGETVKAEVRKFGEVDARKCLEVLGVLPENVACLKSFLGDSDNIPRGVPRMRTAILTKLAMEGTSPSSAYKNAKTKQLLTDKELQRIVKYKEQLDLNYRLIRLRTNLKLLTKKQSGDPKGLMDFLAANSMYGVDVGTIKQITGHAK